MKISQERSTDDGLLTRSSLFNFLGCDRKNCEYFHHDLYDHIRHCCGGLYFRVRFETLKELLDPREDINEYVLAGIDIFSRLSDKQHQNDSHRRIDANTHQEKDTDPGKNHFGR